MSPRARRALLFAGIPLLALLHNDVWLWDDPRFLLGLPVGLLYHIAFCVAATALMTLLVRFAWPEDLEVEDDRERGR